MKRNHTDDILDSLGDALIATDLKGKITRMNHAAETLTGFYAPDTLEKNLDEILHISDIPTGVRYDHLIEQVLKKGKITWQSYNAELFTRDNARVPIDGSVAPVFDAEGIPCGAVLLLRNITEPRQIENVIRDARDQFQHLFNLSPIATIFTSLPDRVFIDINRATETLIGYKRHELIGHSTMEFDIFAIPEEYEKILQQLSEHGHVEGMEAHIKTNRNDILTCILYIETLHLQNSQYSLTQLVDVTEQRKMEKSLAENESNYRELVQNANSVIMRWKNSGEIIFFNEFAQRFLDTRPRRLWASRSVFWFPIPIRPGITFPRWCRT